MNTNDVKFNWRSFSKFIIDLKSLTRIKMCIFAKIVWMTRFSNFLILTCNSLFFCFWLKLSSRIKRFSSHCRLKKQNWNHWCHSQCSLLHLKHLNFLRLCIAAWWAWFLFLLRSCLTDFCTKRSYHHNNDFFWDIICIDRFLWFYRLIIALNLQLISS